MGRSSQHRASPAHWRARPDAGRRVGCRTVRGSNPRRKGKRGGHPPRASTEAHAFDGGGAPGEDGRSCRGPRPGRDPDHAQGTGCRARRDSRHNETRRRRVHAVASVSLPGRSGRRASDARIRRRRVAVLRRERILGALEGGDRGARVEIRTRTRCFRRVGRRRTGIRACRLVYDAASAPEARRRDGSRSRDHDALHPRGVRTECDRAALEHRSSTTTVSGAP